MDDLISRAQAIEALHEDIDWLASQGARDLPLQECMDRAKSILTVLPAIEPRRGRWTLKENVFGVAYCSECDYELHTNNTNFCPNCGSDNREGEQDE